MINLGSAYGEIQIGTDKAQQSVQSLAQTMRNVGQTMTTTLSLPILGVMGAGLNAAAGFEQAMNQIQVVGGVAADAMSSLNATALQLGAETSFSAGEAAQGMLELAKAGLDAEEVMSSIGGTLDLAAAGNLSVAQAAEITANAMNSFSLPAEEATRVANLLAAAANSSSVEVTDMAQAFAMSGSVFGANKVPIDQLAASIAILGNNGLKGSDAGTSMKTMLMRLTSPTAEAADVMRHLGLQVYNADGSMRNFQDIVADLGAVTANLTDEQRNMALTTVFGADAIRAANILIKEGAGEFENMMGAVNQAGAATDVANARMKGLAGAIQYIKGTIESLMIGAFQPFLQGLGDMIRGIADAMAAFGQLPQPIINASLAFAAVLGVAGPVIFAMGQIGAVVGALLSPIGLVTLAIGALAAAFAADFMGIRSAAAQVGTALGDLWTAMLWIFQGQADNIDWWWDIAEAFGFTGDAAMAVGDTLFTLGVQMGNVIAAFRNFGADAIMEVVAQLTGLGLNTYDTTEAIEGLVGALTGSEAIGSAAGEWIFNLGTIFQGLRERVTGAVQAMSATLTQLWSWLSVNIPAGLAVLQGWWNSVWPALSAAVSAAWAAVGPALQQMWNWLSVNIPAGLAVLQGVTSSAWGAIQSAITAAWNAIAPPLQQLWGGLSNLASNFMALDGPNKAFVAALEGLGALLPVVAGAGGVGLLSAALGAVTAVVGGVVSALGALLSPLGLVAAGAILLGVAWTNNWAGIRDVTANAVSAIQEAWGSLMGLLEPAISRLQTAFGNMGTGLGELGPKFGALQEAISAAVTAIIPIVQMLGMVIGGVIGVVATFAINNLAAVFEALPTVVGAAIDQVTAVITLIATTVQGVTDTISALLQGDFAGAWTGVQTIIGGVMTYVQSTAANMGVVVMAVLGLVKNVIVNTFSDLASALGLDGVLTKISEFKDSVLALFSVEGLTGVRDAIAGMLGLDAGSLSATLNFGFTTPDWLAGFLAWVFPSPDELLAWAFPDIPTIAADWWPEIPGLAADWWPEIPGLTSDWWPGIPALASSWWPSIPSLPTGWWPDIPKLMSGWWPTIPGPKWLDSLLNWSPSMPSWVGSLLSWVGIGETNPNERSRFPVSNSRPTTTSTDDVIVKRPDHKSGINLLTSMNQISQLVAQMTPIIDTMDNMKQLAGVTVSAVPAAATTVNNVTISNDFNATIDSQIDVEELFWRFEKRLSRQMSGR